MIDDAEFRPLPLWPYPVTQERRWRPFGSDWQSTEALLEREIVMLGGYDVLIATGHTEGQIRQGGGMPRQDAREPDHPGVEISFDSDHGRLVYATDCCSHWRDNVRSIAKGLEALRAVDRFGVSRKGQQYAGYKALPMPSEGQVATPLEVLIAYAGGEADADMAAEDVYNIARARTHPDKATGSHEAFLAVTKAWEALQ